jgi:hypothetical protein
MSAIVSMCASVFLVPLAASAATVPLNKISISQHNGFNFNNSVSYSLVSGQPTGAGKLNGQNDNFPEGTCAPGSIEVQHSDNTTGDIPFIITFDYKQGTTVAVTRLEGVTTAVSGLPRQNVTDLNQLTFTGNDFASITSFGSSTGTITAAITGPYSGTTGTTAISGSDTKRHYNVVLSSVPKSEPVYVLYCSRLGVDASDLTSNINLDATKSDASGGGAYNINVNRLLSLPSLTLFKAVSGGSALPEQWSFNISPSVNGVSAYAIPSGSDNVTISNIPFGTTSISVTESGPSSHVFSSGTGTNCTFDGSAATASVSAGGGTGNPAIQNAICNFTNTYVSPTLTVIKVVTNNNGGTAQASDFTLFIDETVVTSSQTNSLSAGTYTVSESGGPSGYLATFSGDCDESGSVMLSDGDNKTCTITNDDIAPKLTVTKVVVNDNGGTLEAFNFPLFVDGETQVTSGEQNEFSAGTHTVSESNQEGYAASFSGDCDPNGNVMLAVGEEKTCTITNNDIAPTLTVIKNVVNNNGGAEVASAFQMYVGGESGQTSMNFAGSATGTTVTLKANVFYEVNEEGPSGYTASMSDGCSGTPSLGAVITCTVTNDDQQATLKVIKNVLNDSGGELLPENFTLSVVYDDESNGVATPNSFPGASGTGTAVLMDAGAYHVTEQATEGYSTVDYSSDCAGTIAPGETKTCTVTNFDDEPPPPTNGTLIVIKQVTNDNGGTLVSASFIIRVNASAATPDSFEGADEPGISVTVSPGAYSVTEDAVSGYVATFSEECSGTIAAGETKTCTVTNDDQPATLTVVKTVNNTHGGTMSAEDFTLSVTGEGNVSLGNQGPSQIQSLQIPIDQENNTVSFSGNAEGTTVTLDAGEYSVTEASTTGYSASFGEGCSGTIAPGEQVTCTVTNSDQPATLTVIKNVVNTHGGTKTASDFTLELFVGSSEESESFLGSASGTVFSLNAGSFSVTEASTTAGYVVSLDENCSGTLTIGESRTCTVTNSDVAGEEVVPSQGTLIVIKNVVNTNGRTKVAGDFTLRLAATEASTSTFAGVDGEGIAITLQPGTYAVTEDESVGYITRFSDDCSGTIAAGQTKTCTVTNSDVATVTTPTVSNGGGGGGGGSTPPSPQNIQPSGFATPAPRVLGVETSNPSFTSSTSPCAESNPELLLITENADAAAAGVGVARDLALESFVQTRLLDRVLPQTVVGDVRARILNFIVYGTPRSRHVGIGERAGIVASYRAAYGRFPDTDCDWGDLLNISMGLVPNNLNPAREQSVGDTFRTFYGRAPDRSKAAEDRTIFIMAYGLRPAVRDLNAERAGIRLFRRVMRKIPVTATEWDAIRGMVYGGLGLPR